MDLQGINDGIMNNYVYMKTWVTEIRTIDGNIWHGPDVNPFTLGPWLRNGVMKMEWDIVKLLDN